MLKLTFEMLLIAFIAYSVAAISLATLVVAIWSLRWPRVKGLIDLSIYDREWGSDGFDGRQKNGKFYITYSYTVDGIGFEGTRISPLIHFEWQLSGSPDLSNSYDRSKRYREGAIVYVSYCPSLPGWSCLEPGGFFSALLLGAIAAVLFFVCERA